MHLFADVVIFFVVLIIVGLLLVLVEVKDFFKVVVLLDVLVLVITDVFGEIVFKLPLRSVLLLFADVCIVVVMGLVYLSKNENG
jgi:di/tricarboxylate transporter